MQVIYIFLSKLLFSLGRFQINDMLNELLIVRKGRGAAWTI